MVLFVAALIVWNWSSVSWIFNYEFLSERLDIFSQQNITNEAENRTVIETETGYVEEANFFAQENSIEIPKIGLDSPLIFTDDNSEEAFKRNLKKGIVHYPDSVLPGQDGQTIFLGHSAPENWPEINYYKIFSRLNEIEEGDEIFIYFEHRCYEYRMTKRTIVEPGKRILPNLTNSRSVLLLLTCWPPGKSYQRMAVQAERII